MYIDESDYLSHYGTPRHSGRYPWGSGGAGDLHNSMSFADHYAYLKKNGMTDKEIVEGLNLGSTTQLRAKLQISKSENRQKKINEAEKLRAKGMSYSAIAKQMDLAGESSVRALLAPGVKEKASVIETTSKMLEEQVKEKKQIDIGSGVENYLGISKERLAASVAVVKEKGYTTHTFNEEQLGTGLDTKFKVLAMPGVTQKEAWMNRYNTRLIDEYSDDGGETTGGFKTPISIDPKRVSVRFKEDGGDLADGVIYVRPGIKDIELGQSRYAQVRVQVGDNHYLKGMAMYKDDLPSGTDLLFNTNKEQAKTPNKLDALKPLSDNPFVSVRRQIKDDKDNVTSAMNIVNEQGDWKDWKKTISSQVLSKQPTKLAEDQLKMTYEKRKMEYDQISKLTNPTVKKKLLETFADSTDSSAVRLDAAKLPRQAWHAILPIETLSPSHVYAPQYDNGETVSLIRYPHGGTFEIPTLKVNNKHRDSIKLIGNAEDAIGIHPNVAERLSGADFDGDTVLVIPNGKGKIKTSPALEGLKNFNPRTQYREYPGMKVISSDVKQREMGNVSNLITDMTIRKANHEELARAVRHSMVIIDSEKHKLDYKQSALDNNIAQLKREYQGKSRAGASTLISRAGSKERIPDRKIRTVPKGGPIDPATGRRMYEPSGKTRINKEGVRVPKTEKVKKLALTDDAFTLSSGTTIERVYAEHSNKLKALANKARLESSTTKDLKYSPSAAKAHSKQVDSLNSKLNVAIRNRPLERQATLLGNSLARARISAEPGMEQSTKKKIKAQSLETARARTGAKKHDITFTQDEWNAIQEGAISPSKLREIMRYADLDSVKEKATPHKAKLMTPAKTNRAKSMLASGYTWSEVAAHLGVSVTTLENAL